MRINPSEFRARPLRVHAFLKDVPLEDVWAIRLPGGGADRTIGDVRAVLIEGAAAAPAIVRGLFRLRGRIGALLGWDKQNPAWNSESWVHRLTTADRAQSTATPGTPDERLSLVYRFENEQLSERRNGTVHAFSSLSIQPVPGGYLAYLAIFVKPVHRLTWLYMAAIAPFRRLIVYPAIVRNAQAAWARLYGPASVPESWDRLLTADAGRHNESPGFW
jgi:Protein of unknown function (DUF2867)